MTGNFNRRCLICPRARLLSLGDMATRKEQVLLPMAGPKSLGGWDSLTCLKAGTPSPLSAPIILAAKGANTVAGGHNLSLTPWASSRGSGEEGPQSSGWAARPYLRRPP